MTIVLRVRRYVREKDFDFILAGVTLLLSIIGILVLAGISAPFGIKNFGFPGAYLFHQLLYGLLPGLLFGLLCIFISLERIKRFSFLFFLLSFLALLLVFFPPFGVKLGGASRWLEIGPLFFQPSEILKLTFILYWAALLARKSGEKSERAGNSRGYGSEIGLLFFLFVVGILGVILVMQPDVSTFGIIVASAFAMYFVAKTPLRYSIAIIIIAIIAFSVLINLASYRMQRILVFLNPSVDPMGIGYQAKQALIAVGSGGFFGKGLGMELDYVHLLPTSFSDIIFALIAQEMGFVGSVFLLSLFFLFVWRGCHIAKEAQNEFSRLAAIGITTWIGLQGFANMGSVIGLLPLAGIPLPFISYGGSHLIMEFIGAGMLLNISKNKTAQGNR